MSIQKPKRANIKDALSFSLKTMFNNPVTWLLVPFLVSLVIAVGYFLTVLLTFDGSIDETTTESDIGKIIMLSAVVIFSTLLIILASFSSMIWMSLQHVKGNRVSWKEAVERKFLPQVAGSIIVSQIIISIALSASSIITAVIMYIIFQQSFSFDDITSGATPILAFLITLLVFMVLILFINSIVLFIPFSVADDNNKHVGFFKKVNSGIRIASKNFWITVLSVIIIGFISSLMGITIIGSLFIIPFAMLFYAHFYAQLTGKQVVSPEGVRSRPYRVNDVDNTTIPQAKDFLKDPEYPSASQYSSRTQKYNASNYE